MSQRKLHTSAVFGTATIMTAAGILFGATPAADAAPCENWFYPTEDFGFEQDNGIVGRLYLRDSTTFEGPASHTVAGKPDVTGGRVKGDIKGRQIYFRVDWNNGVWNSYFGQIADDGTAGGTTFNSNVKSNRWWSLAKFYCPAPPLGESFEPPPGVQGPVDATAPFEAPPGVQGPVDATAPFEPPPGVRLPG